MGVQEDGRRALYYLIPVAILLVGSAVCFGIAFWLFNVIDHGMIRADFPKMRVVELSKTGTYYVYHEFKTVYDGYTVDNDPDLLTGRQIVFSEKSIHQEIPISRTSMTANYQNGDTEGNLIGKLVINSPGSYEIKIEPDITGKTIVLAFGLNREIRVLQLVFSIVIANLIVLLISGYVFYRIYKKLRLKTNAV
jgi:hypothetical protein